MGPRPLLLKEFSILPRRKGYYVRRSAHLWILGLMVLVGLLFGSTGQAQTVGLKLFQWMTYIMLMIFGFSAPLSTGQSMFAERRERTLPLLYMTDLRHRDIILGKGLASFLQLGINMLAVLPLYILCVTLGGISTGQVLSAFLVLMALLYTGTAAGLLAATLFRKERAMVGWIIFGGLLYYAALPVAVGIGAKFFGWSAEIITWVSPLVAIREVGLGVNLSPVWVHVGITLIIGTVLWPLVLLFGQNRIDDTAEDTGVRSSGGGRPIHALRDSLGDLAKTSNPGAVMRWRDHQFRFGGFRHELFIGLTVIGVLSIIISGGMLFAGSRWSDILSVLLFVSAGTGASFYLILGISRGASAFDAERRSGVLEVLFTTPMEPRYVVRGKFYAVVRSVFPWIGISFGFGLIFGIAGAIVGTNANVGSSLAIVLFSGIGAAAYCITPVLFVGALGMALSLSMRPGFATGICFGVLVFWTACFRNMLAMPFMFVGGIVSGFGNGGNDSLATAIMVMIQAIPLIGLDILAMFITLGVVESRLKTVVTQREL